MNKTMKINVLHKIAHGQSVNISAEEKRELKKYKIYADDSNYATKTNISAYVTAVDDGYRLSFCDWCANNLRGDRRRKGGSASEIAANNKAQSGSAVFVGWLLWGMAIFWLCDGNASVGSCAIIGAIVTFVLQKCFRRWAGFVLFLLPCILAVIFFER